MPDAPAAGAPLPLRASALPIAGVPGPSYDRDAVRAGIVHIGVGGFHRAHEAMFVDRLLEAGGADEWGICGVGLLPGDARMRDVLEAQDGLYTLVLKNPDGTVEPRILGAIVEYLFAPDDPEAVIERMASPEIRIVSLTLTEGGYFADPDTGTFDAEAAGVYEGLSATQPLTAFGLVVEALVRRRERDLEPFVVLSTDNVVRNGDTARAAFAAAAGYRSAELGEWVRTSVHFPNSMVDRITPGTTDADRAALERDFGIRDGWPVVAEPFVQWVLEDWTGDATAGDASARPQFEQVGVQLVASVDPYEQMKLRLLNAGHQTIGYLGYLAGHRTTDSVLADELFAHFLFGYLSEEGRLAVPDVPGVDLNGYVATLFERFGNPAVRDTLLRLCTEGVDRIRTFLLPVLRDRLAASGSIRHGVLVVAGWARFVDEVDEDGAPIEVTDRHLDAIRRTRNDDPAALLRATGVVGELADDPRFLEPYTKALAELRVDGTRAAVQRIVTAAVT